MPKHPREENAPYPESRSSKRVALPDRLSKLSDELLLRILSYLPTSTLTCCQRISHRFYVMAGDSQVWKSAYYNRFVRPRASRIPGIRDKDSDLNSLLFSSKTSKWLDDENLVRQGQETDWKQQYKLRHNWSTGSCNVSELQVARKMTSRQPFLVQLHEDVAVTADALHGLQAWRLKSKQALLAAKLLNEPSQRGTVPTALAIETQTDSDETLTIIVGFADGRYSIYELLKRTGKFKLVFADIGPTSGSIEAIAYSFPFLVALRHGEANCIANCLSIYSFSAQNRDTEGAVGSDFNPPKLIASLKSDNVWPPISLSLRTSAQNILISIAYAQPTILVGWSVGLQELRLTPEGIIADSRLACALNRDFTSLSRISSALPSGTVQEPSTLAMPNVQAPISLTVPTSLSYTHPYLLASHPDNTLMFYLVTSTSNTLSISQGTRLWGHTSSVSEVHIGGRGKAVSVSSYGEELRVWELEGGISSTSSRRRLAAGERSVQLRPERRSDSQSSGPDLISEAISTRGNGLARTLETYAGEVVVTKGLVGFDDEKVVVLREREPGSMALVVYDFK